MNLILAKLACFLLGHRWEVVDAADAFKIFRDERCTRCGRTEYLPEPPPVHPQCRCATMPIRKGES